MSHWKEFMRRRQLSEGLASGVSPVDKFRFNTDDADDDVAQDHEKLQHELFKVVMSKYPNETMDFLNTIANRGDEEVSSLLRKVRRDKGPKLPKEPQHPTDGDEVVPSMADRGHNPEAE